MHTKPAVVQPRFIFILWSSARGLRLWRVIKRCSCATGGVPPLTRGGRGEEGGGRVGGSQSFQRNKNETEWKWRNWSQENVYDNQSSPREKFRARRTELTNTSIPALVGVATKHVVSDPDQRHCRAFVVASGMESTGTEGVLRGPEAQLPLRHCADLHGLQIFLQLLLIVGVTLENFGDRLCVRKDGFTFILARCFRQ